MFCLLLSLENIKEGYLQQVKKGGLIGYFTVFSKPLIIEEKLFIKKEFWKW